MPDSHCSSPWVRLGILSVWELVLGIILCASFVKCIILQLEDNSKGMPQTNSSTSTSSSDSGMPRTVVMTLGFIILILIHFVLSFRLCRAALASDVSKLRQKLLTIMWIFCGFILFAVLCAGDNNKYWGDSSWILLFASFVGAFIYRVLTLLKLGPFLSRIHNNQMRYVEPMPPLQRRPSRSPREDVIVGFVTRSGQAGFPWNLPHPSLRPDVVNDGTMPREVIRPSAPPTPPFSVAVKTEEEEDDPPPSYEAVVVGLK